MCSELWLLYYFQSCFLSGDYQYGRQFAGSPTLSTMTSNSSPSLTSSIPESERDLVKLTLTTPMYRIAKALAAPNSGLDVKDRVWLKMTIPKSFIGGCCLLCLNFVTLMFLWLVCVHTRVDALCSCPSLCNMYTCMYWYNTSHAFVKMLLRSWE